MRLTRILKILLALLLLPVLLAGAAEKEFVVMLDPGHGGKDAGALGRRTNEKSVNLGVAKKLRALLAKDKDVRVEMTRDADYFVTLKGRSNLANKNKADIFVSIHANAIDRKSPMFSSINGAAVYTLGLKKSDTNLSIAMRENEVMKLEPDYSTTYEGFDPSSTESYIAFEMMQHSNLDQSIQLAEAVQNQLVRTAGRKNNGVRQAPFWVLVGTSMPAILVELDFICNPAMEKFMMSEKGQDKLALAIYRGIEKYRKGKTSVSSVSTAEPTSANIREAEERVAENNADKSDKVQQDAPADVNTKDKIVYKIQFLTSPSPLKKGDARFKGLKPVDSYRDGGTIKYTYGSFSSQQEASRELKRVKKLFRDAFIIETRNGKRIK